MGESKALLVDHPLSFSVPVPQPKTLILFLLAEESGSISRLLKTLFFFLSKCTRVSIQTDDHSIAGTLSKIDDPYLQIMIKAEISLD